MRSTPNNHVYGELGRYPLFISRHVRIVKYWLSIVTGENSSFVCAVYNEGLRTIEHNRPSWIKSVRDLLRSTGFADVWLCQGVGDKNLFLKVFKSRYVDIFQQQWQINLDDSPKALFYRSIKSHHVFSSYLDKVNAQTHRIALTRLIVSSHKLRIETGRWTNPVTPREERFCPHCPRNKIEDEYHFLFECILYNELRKRFIPTYYWKRPSMFKLVDLFNTENKALIQRVAKYVYLAMELKNGNYE